MKNLKSLLVAAFSIAAIAVSAQDFSNPAFAKYGDTPEERKANVLLYNFYKDAYVNRNWAEATRMYPEVVAKCPKASVNIYIYGATAFKGRIAAEKDAAKKAELVDSLLHVYDQRMEHFGEHAKFGITTTYPLKAREYLTYKYDDRAGVRDIMGKAIEACGDQAEPDFVVLAFSELVEDYKTWMEVEADVILDTYERYEPLVAADEKAKSDLEALFGQSGAAQCENLEKLFRSKLEAAPEDLALLERAFALMSRPSANCGENAFYVEIAEKQHAVKPTAATADFLANVFQNRGENEKALKYINDVLGNTTDPVELSKLYSRIAGLEIAQNNYSEAAKAAKTAREHNPENGLAYFFLAQAYAATTGGCQGIDKNAVYWAAYDMMSQARKLMEADAEMQSIVEVADKMMGAYRGGFPTAEDGFFNDLKAGQGYTVKCGLAAGTSTTVRFK